MGKIEPSTKPDNSKVDKELEIREILDRYIWNGQNVDSYEKGVEKLTAWHNKEIVKARITKEWFEANLLDGDKVEDCGNAMLSAKNVWEVLSELSKEQEGE